MFRVPHSTVPYRFLEYKGSSERNIIIEFFSYNERGFKYLLSVYFRGTPYNEHIHTFIMLVFQDFIVITYFTKYNLTD